jgi:hypothetical protein
MRDSQRQEATMIEDEGATAESEESIDDILAEKWHEIESRDSEQETVHEESPQEVLEKTEPEQDKQDEPVQTIKPPSSWKKDLQEKFNTLPPEFQQEIQRREDDFHKGIESYKSAAEWTRQFEPIADTFAGLKQVYGSEAQGIKTLFDAGQFANNDPIGFIKAFAESRGISLDGTAIDQQQNPIINQLKQQVEQLSGYVGTQQQQEQQRTQQEAEKAIEAFKSKPGAEHFEVLKSDMAALLQAGLADGLDDAYDQALWRRPDLRESEISKQITERQKKAKESVLSAKQASSVNVKQRGHKPSAEAEMPMEEFMAKKVAELGLG